MPPRELMHITWVHWVYTRLNFLNKLTLFNLMENMKHSLRQLLFVPHIPAIGYFQLNPMHFLVQQTIERQLNHNFIAYWSVTWDRTTTRYHRGRNYPICLDQCHQSHDWVKLGHIGAWMFGGLVLVFWISQIIHHSSVMIMIFIDLLQLPPRFALHNHFRSFGDYNHRKFRAPEIKGPIIGDG